MAVGVVGFRGECDKVPVFLAGCLLSLMKANYGLIGATHGFAFLALSTNGHRMSKDTVSGWQPMTAIDSRGKEGQLSLDVAPDNPYRDTPWPEGPHAPAEGRLQHAGL